MPAVQYLGHRITDHGLQPSEAKVRAITEAPAPKDVPQLRSFLGRVNYYGNFLANLATTLAPLHKQLKKGEPWRWGEEHDKAFEEVQHRSF